MVIDAIAMNEPLQVFISARGGGGKTYLLNTILKAVQSKEDQGCVQMNNLQFILSLNWPVLLSLEGKVISVYMI